MFHRGKLSDDALASRIARTREAGYARGASEARLMLLAVGRKIERRRALDWLNSAVQNGRIELQKQCAVDREIEAWDMSCIGSCSWYRVSIALPARDPLLL